MPSALAAVPDAFLTLPLPRKLLCVAVMVVAYLWPLLGIVVAAILRWRRARAPYAFFALAGVAAALAIFCGEYLWFAIAG